MYEVATPAARATDPATSHEAAEHITATGARAAQQRLAVEAVKQYPGLTSRELGRRTTLCRFLLARRLPECETGKSVKRGQARRCSVSGRMAVTWWPADAVPQQQLFPKERIA
jgi:hypothetical protein